MYSWNPIDPLILLGISSNRLNRLNVFLECPFCGSKRFSYNTQKGIGRCFSCSETADSAKFYAVSTGMSLADARIDIERRLGIQKDAAGTVERTIPPRIIYNTQHKEAEKAPDDVLDKTYRAFLSELTLSDKNRYMLQARGLSDEEIDALGYKTFPTRSEVNFFALCKRLQSDGYTLKGVPGFFKTGKGDYTFIQLTPGIIMPQRNHKEQITGLQIRKDDDLRSFIEELGDYEAKCAWFSSPNREGGCGVSANVHYACDFKYSKEHKQFEPVFEDGFILTEGIMKGDITHFLQPNCPVIAVPGVHALNHLKTELLRLKDMGLKTILLCYDMDYLTNPNVQSALEKTKTLIADCGLRCKSNTWETHIKVDGEIKPLLKGIDDYLAYAKLGIIPKIQEKTET